MLNSLGLHHKLGISDSGDKEEFLYSTAALGYPIFVASKNYNGHSPSLQAVPFLRNRAVKSLREELIQMERPLIIPLGKTVEGVIRELVSRGLVDELQCLSGFPHPSGANGHRHSQFAKMFNQLKEMVSGFSEES